MVLQWSIHGHKTFMAFQYFPLQCFLWNCYKTTTIIKTLHVPWKFSITMTSHQIHRIDLPFIDNSEISFLFWITHPNMSALNHIANRESIYKLFFCSRYFCRDQNQFMAKFFFLWENAQFSWFELPLW